MYTYVVDVAVSDLRAHLSEWLDRVKAGEELIITERGVPVARILGLSSTSVIERLTREGVIGRPERSTRPVATGLRRPRARRPVSDIIGEQRG